jgi:hypothetical protein
MNTITDRTAVVTLTLARPRALSVVAPASIGGPQMANGWLSSGAGVPDQRHVCVRSSVFINDNSIGSTAASRTMSGPTASAISATKYAAPPRGIPR